MGKIKKILENELVGGTQNTDVYPVTSVKAVYDESNERLDHILSRRGTVNVSTNYNDDHIAEILTLSQAIAKVPSSDRVLGFTMTFLSSEGWNTYQFGGDSLSEWGDTTKWSSTQNDSLANANESMQGIGRYTYWSNSQAPSIYIEGSHRVLNWKSLAILDSASHIMHAKYFNKELNMILPLGGVLVIYGEVVEDENQFSVFYDITGRSLNSGESHTEFYKKINNIKDIVIIGVVETVAEKPRFFDFLKIASYSWGGVPSLTSDVNTLTSDVNTLTSDVNTFKGEYAQYSYWTPSKQPVLQVGENNKGILSFPSLTIARLPDLEIVLNNYSQDIELDSVARILSFYYDRKDNRIYYVTPGNGIIKDKEDSKSITDMTSIVPLGIIENGTYIDVLALSSRYIYHSYDLSILGKIERLKPDTIEPVIFTKYKWDVVGSKGPTNIGDIRLSKALHIKHKYVYVRGKVDFEEGAIVPQLSIYMDDRNKTGTGLKNLWHTIVPKDEQGNFNAMFVIPDNIWDNVDFNVGYNLFILIDNTHNNETLTLNVYEAYVADYAGADNQVILDNEALEDTIKYAENLNPFINVYEDSNIYGRYSPESPLDLQFSVAAHVDYSVTTTNSESQSDGYLYEVRAQIRNAGTYKFKVGLLDQYPRFVTSYEFTLALSDGLNIINVLDKKIPIAKGEQLAISCTSIKGVSGNSSIAYRQNVEPIEHELFYGYNNGTWYKLNTEYGGEINLSYKVIGLDSVFALKSELDNLAEQIEKQDSTINSLRYVYDNNGTPYKLSIYNGEVVVKSVQYKKVLALGNSLTSHAYAEKIGYYGDTEWAMASTNRVTTTWTNHLQTILRQKQPSATVTPFNISSWEINYMGVNLDNLFASHKGVNYDLIIIRAGENGTAGDDYAQGVDRLVSYLRENFPLADIIITDMFWHNTVKETGFREIAEKYNYPYISFGNITDKCLLGQMLLGRDNTFHPITHNGVAGHCTDVCFFDFANILANSLGYQQISGKYTVKVNSSIDYSINQLSQIKDGYVSILTYGSSEPNINIKQGDNVIQCTNHSLNEVSWINTPSKVPSYVTTFKMPEGDVTVTIQ